MANAVPDDLATALSGAPDANAIFEKLPPSHQRRYIEWIEDAKKVNTRERRIAKAITMLTAGEQQG